MDDICGIKHEYYFAYGSNMLPERLLERIGKYHTAFPVYLSDYRFVYNKKSCDGTTKANIECIKYEVVHGVCFEIDSDDIAILQKYEVGYNRANVSVSYSKDKLTSVVTFISSSIDETLKPSSEYKGLVLKGASHWHLDKSYVTKYLS